MKVLLINGSPNQNGCTFTALSEVANTLNQCGVETELLQIGKKPIRGCIDCRKCRTIGKCVFDDDMVNVAAAKLKESDGLVVGSPVYYGGPNGSILSFLDRMFFSSDHASVAFKPAAAVVSARRAGTTATLDVLNKYFPISGMPIVPSQYWNMVHGYTPEDVRKDEEGLQIMRTLGRNMAWMLKCIEAGRAAGILPPEREPFQQTNFIR